MAVNCPECYAVLDVDEDELDEGDPLTCEECGANITVTSKDPLELSVSDEDDEDDDEDDDFDEDEDEDLDEDEEDEDEDDNWR
jgi:alpha-aminoadipate/glutamate carrier protein LysW